MCLKCMLTVGLVSRCLHKVHHKIIQIPLYLLGPLCNIVTCMCIRTLSLAEQFLSFAVCCLPFSQDQILLLSGFFLSIFLTTLSACMHA